ncbi:DUF4280 domain-containing protein [Oxalobacter vibrioformis]|uniref:DUF4280 domain-containing protein n=1 Tax=Oxalobacter vibrioformis TaxID=933080 RepID=A0A9E9LZN8_9BURK|nr:DUF4280 domain-containing protein [Oxalobacter vibrioformis]WAW10492.1 DUF4280 domain-containing protein [Oxalobacter vibrioformis]
MSLLVTQGSLCQCSFGMAPCTLTVLPTARTMAGGQPTATIMDHKPFVNMTSFGMCNSPANPAVAAATAAALGVLTPMPCIPNTAAPWVPGHPAVLIGNQPALTHNSRLMCMWGGVISIMAPGQFTVQV